jgi:hypothetical protein
MSGAHQGALEKPTSRLATKHGSNVRYGSSLVQSPRPFALKSFVPTCPLWVISGHQYGFR